MAKFVIKPYEHEIFLEWWNSRELKNFREASSYKGSPTDETYEKIFISGYRLAYDTGYDRGQSDGPACIGPGSGYDN